MGRSEYHHHDIAKYVCELVGTYILVLTVTLNTLSKYGVGNYGASLSVGGILMVMVFAMGSVSGAHFNPAVTLAVYLAGSGRSPRHSISRENALFYVLSQLEGALLAGFTYFLMHGPSHTPQPRPHVEWRVNLFGELLYTAVLCYVVLNVSATDKHCGNQYFGLAIGFTVVAAAIAMGGVAGCTLNPAVAFGLMITNCFHIGAYAAIRTFPLTCAVPLLGSVLGWAMFYGVRKNTEFAGSLILDNESRGRSTTHEQILISKGVHEKTENESRGRSTTHEQILISKGVPHEKTENESRGRSTTHEQTERERIVSEYNP